MTPFFPRAWGRASGRRTQKRRPRPLARQAGAPRRFRFGWEPLEPRVVLANFGFAVADINQTTFGPGNAATTDAAGNAYLLASDAVYKYAPVGALAWTTPYNTIAAGFGSNSKEGIAVDAAGDIYITGSFFGTATFGSTTLTGSTKTPSIFLAKLDSAGNYLWAESLAGNSGGANSLAITVD
ncbi:MAG: hypothetical protein ACREJM_11285, partial [Candidatus Saccharimonadales bacterium]